MPKLTNSLQDWNSGSFSTTLKNEVENLEVGTLPLEKGTSQGGFVDDSNIAVTVLRTIDDEKNILANVGIFFTEIVINCGCGDDPMPINAYCEMQIRINKNTAEADINVMKD